jgi:hypothetical protein
MNSKYFNIAGKSGTAEVGVKKDHIQSWIAGYFPYEKPKYAFVFLCSMGIRDQSPTPNVLAKDVLEHMYFTERDLFDGVEYVKPYHEPVTKEEDTSQNTSTTTVSTSTESVDMPVDRGTRTVETSEDLRAR